MALLLKKNLEFFLAGSLNGSQKCYFISELLIVVAAFWYAISVHDYSHAMFISAVLLMAIGLISDMLFYTRYFGILF